jgi:hypothetical protein
VRRAWVLAAALAGCATISGRHERVRVVTRPAPAEVRDEDGTRLGEAPAIVEVPRASSRRLTVQPEGAPAREVPLEGRYRWGTSLGGNAILLAAGALWWLAPVGVGVDLLSGAAWSYDPPPPVTMPDVAPAERRRRIVVVPPHAGRERVSDEVGADLGAWAAARWPDADVVRLDAEADRLAEYEWTYAAPTPPAFRDDLLYELRATHLLRSEVRDVAAGYEVRATLEDPFAGATADEATLLYAPEALHSAGAGAWDTALDVLVGLVPNSVAFDVTSPTVTVDARRTVGGETTSIDATQPTQNRYLRWLTGLTVRNIRSSVVRGTWGLRLSLGPSIGLAWTTLDFENARHHLEWLQASGGVGPEGGVETPLGYVYLSLVPQLGTSYLIAHAERDASRFDVSLRFEGELGWQFFVTRSLSLRLFARGVTMPSGPLEEVLEAADSPDADIHVSQVKYAVAGLSFGWCLPEMRRAVKGALR